MSGPYPEDFHGVNRRESDRQWLIRFAWRGGAILFLLALYCGGLLGWLIGLVVAL